jgi:cytochrome d ubiquinol oxidase subunit I
VPATHPLKLAALVGLSPTERGAPLRILGLPDPERRETRWAIEIPRGLSLLAFHDPGAEVRGLEDFPREHWPPVRRVHVCFQVMVALGAAMAALSLAGLLLALRRRPWPRAYLRAVVALGPAGFVALEAGWLVTEWGRQPFVAHGLLTTAAAVTPVGRLGVPLVVFTGVYVLLAVVTAILLWRQIAASPGATREGGG